jgi:hypothetical protein
METGGTAVQILAFGVRYGNRRHSGAIIAILKGAPDLTAGNLDFI